MQPDDIIQHNAPHIEVKATVMRTTSKQAKLWDKPLQGRFMRREDRGKKK